MECCSLLSIPYTSRTAAMGADTRLWEPLQGKPLSITEIIIGDWNTKVGNQETLRLKGKFGLGVQNEAGQRLIEFCQENALVLANTHLNNTREASTRGQHQLVNTEIRLIIFFAAKDGEALYSQQKQNRELTVAQNMNSLLPNSDWNWRRWWKPLDHSGMT